VNGGRLSNAAKADAGILITGAVPAEAPCGTAIDVQQLKYEDLSAYGGESSSHTSQDSFLIAESPRRYDGIQRLLAL